MKLRPWKASGNDDGPGTDDGRGQITPGGSEDQGRGRITATTAEDVSRHDPLEAGRVSAKRRARHWASKRR